jgi:hypothetical protein
LEFGGDWNGEDAFKSRLETMVEVEQVRMGFEGDEEGVAWFVMYPNHDGACRGEIGSTYHTDLPLNSTQ